MFEHIAMDTNSKIVDPGGIPSANDNVRTLAVTVIEYPEETPNDNSATDNKTIDSTDRGPDRDDRERNNTTNASEGIIDNCKTEINIIDIQDGFPNNNGGTSNFTTYPSDGIPSDNPFFHNKNTLQDEACDRKQDSEVITKECIADIRTCETTTDETDHSNRHDNNPD